MRTPLLEQPVKTVYDFASVCSEKIWQPPKRKYTWNIREIPPFRCIFSLPPDSFFCLNLAHSRQIFVERLPSVVAPYARRTTRLTDVFMMHNQLSSLL